jgi:UDP-3-O-[3-hydroxymyristoyl] glucosamine N-acyltransferase
MLEPETSSALAARHGFEHRGPNTRVYRINPLSSIDDRPEPALTYLSSLRFASLLNTAQGVVVITTATLADAVPRAHSLLITDGAPRDLFYQVLADAHAAGRFERLTSHTSASARIARTAHVDEGVVIDDEAEIGPGAVVMSNTYVGRGAVIKPNAVVGGDGFEVATLGGRQRIVPHAGGVWLEAYTQIGSATCVDRGLFGEFTYVGEETKIDNLVHFAHAARVGRRSSIVACAEISGSCVLGDGVWVGPSVSVNQQVRIGDAAYIGTGAVVTRDLPRHVLAYGAPAKVAAFVCECRTKLRFIDNRATCDQCGKRYTLDGDGAVTRV